MKDKSKTGSASERSARDSQLSAPDELTSFAQEYFSSDFPNAERVGCPTADTLDGLVRAGKAPDELLRAHLFGCSDCFRDYQSALATYRAETKEVAAVRLDSWWNRLLPALSPGPIRVFAGALSLVLLVIVGLFVWREYRTAPEQIVARRDSESVVTPSQSPSRDNLPSATLEASPSTMMPVDRAARGPSPQPTSQQEAPEQPPPPSTEGELIAMSIDLEDYAVTRGGTGNGGEIYFPRGRTRLSLTLPSGSAKGVYTVSVVGASSIALVTSSARSTDGRTLTATLDLRKLTSQKYDLRISREGEPPIDVPIVVTTEKTVSPVKKP